MRSSVPALNTPIDSALHNKIKPLAQPFSNRAMWLLLYLGLILNDALMVAFAFRMAYFLRFEISIPLFQLEVTPSLLYYQTLVIALLPLMVAIFALNGLYQKRNLLGGTREYALLFNSVTIGIFLVIFVTFLFPEFILARGWLFLAWVLTFLTTGVSRFLIRRIIYLLRVRGYFLTPAIIVGANQEGRLIADQLLASPSAGLHLLGFIDDRFTPGTRLFRDLHVLGNPEHVHQLIERYDVEEVIIATSALSRDEMVRIFRSYGVSPNVNLRLSSGLFEIITTGLEVKELAYVPLVSVNKVRLTGIDQVLKFALDYCLTIPGLIALVPAFVLIGLAIKLDSPGPIFHRRRVMGVNGRKFDAFKFRTMYVNGDELLAGRPDLQEELARNHKLKDDPRVTRVGQFLRKTSLDELPQLFNILRGDMSLVGPRMISPEEMTMYNQWGINLLTVRPGLTGLWQVSGRSDLSYENRVRLDMYYIRNWSIWLDLQLLWQTIPVVLTGTGAY